MGIGASNPLSQERVYLCWLNLHTFLILLRFTVLPVAAGNDTLFLLCFTVLLVAAGNETRFSSNI